MVQNQRRDVSNKPYKSRSKVFSIICILLLIGFLLGFMTNSVIDNDSNKITGLKYKAYSQRNSTNSWIYIDISGMSPEEALLVCKHEVGHEIFAEYCENDWDKCMEVTR